MDARTTSTPAPPLNAAIACSAFPVLTGAHALKNDKRPRLRLESWGAIVEQPSPENCSIPTYALSQTS